MQILESLKKSTEILLTDLATEMKLTGKCRVMQFLYRIVFTGTFLPRFYIIEGIIFYQISVIS
jgi:hypothetical protein